jgi:hypothetical protein
VSVFGYLALLAGAAELLFAALAFVYVRRLLGHGPTPISEEIGGFRNVLGKLRKSEPMSQAEWDFAAQTVADRSSLLAFSIPAAVFALGCIFVFGGLEAHGVNSLRPYIGLFPILGSINMTIRLLRIATLKKRLASVSGNTPGFGGGAPGG